MVLSSDLNLITSKLGELAPGDHAEIVGFCVEGDLHHFLQRLFEVGFLASRGSVLSRSNQH